MTHWPDPLQARLVADRRVVALVAIGCGVAAVALVATLAGRVSAQGWDWPAAVIAAASTAALLHALWSLVRHARYSPRVEVDRQGRLTLDGVEAPVERLDAAARARQVVPAELAAPLGRYRRWARQLDTMRDERASA
ncbi:hypothetical protein BH09PSE6_BH09PSE6_24750 [soil metagenome]